MAERIIAKLRRKMTRFALMVQRESGAEHETTHDVINDGHDALIALGHSPSDAREKIEQALRSQGKFKSVDELIQAIYKNERKSSSRSFSFSAPAVSAADGSGRRNWTETR